MIEIYESNYTEVSRVVVNDSIYIKEYKYIREDDGSLTIYLLCTYIDKHETSSIRGFVSARLPQLYGCAEIDGKVYVKDEAHLGEALYKHGTVTRRFHENMGALVRHQSEVR